MKTIFILLCLACALPAASQTKKIAHRSHSGKNMAITANMPGNLGARFPVRELRKYDTSFKHDTLAWLLPDSIQMKPDTATVDTSIQQDSTKPYILPVKKADTLQGSTLPGKQQLFPPMSMPIDNDYTGWLALLIFAGAWGVVVPLLFRKQQFMKG